MVTSVFSESGFCSPGDGALLELELAATLTTFGSGGRESGLLSSLFELALVGESSSGKRRFLDSAWAGGFGWVDAGPVVEVTVELPPGDGAFDVDETPFASPALDECLSLIYVTSTRARALEKTKDTFQNAMLNMLCIKRKKSRMKKIYLK
jgi:hypothetical protein